MGSILSRNEPSDKPGAIHPETAEFADIGVGDWLTDVPEEHDLVDLSTGTAVRWLEGRGWVEESR